MGVGDQHRLGFGTGSLYIFLNVYIPNPLLYNINIIFI